VLSDAGVNWSDVDVLSDAGVNWSEIDVLSDTGVNWVTEFRFAHSDFRLPNGDFTTDIFGARLSYSFTPRILAQSLIQYNSAADIWSANIRFSLLKQANTGLFVVYNETRSGSRVLNRSFIVKYSLMIDVLK